jgi:hypothetical protein
MSKIIEATCVGGVVTADDVPVPAAEILSEGVGESEGILILDEDKAKYIAKTSPDLKATLEKLITTLEKLSAALTAIDSAGPLSTTCGAGPGTATWVPVNASNISAINALKAEVESFKEMLK